MNVGLADDGTSREFNEFMFTPTYFGLANFGVDFPSTISRWKLDRGFKKFIQHMTLELVFYNSAEM